MSPDLPDLPAETPDLPDLPGLLARMQDDALAWVREEPLKAVALAAAAGALLALCLPARADVSDGPA